jgi:hypothetical protein
VKKELYLPLVLIGLSAAFIVVSFLIWITRGNNSLLKKKLRIGAIILSLTGTAIGCESRTCYVPLNDAGQNLIVLNGETYPDGTFILNLALGNWIQGNIHYPTANEYSFQILDGDGNRADRGGMNALDGEYDEHLEAFDMSVRTDIPTGIYDLNFYMASEADLDMYEIKPFAQFRLEIN